MANDSLVRKIFSFSPYVELIGRYLYWKNVDILESRAKKSSKQAVSDNPVDFDKIISCLKDNGVGEGDLLLVHSAYSPLKNSGLSPREVNNELCSLIGDSGTIAMPAMPKFKNEETKIDYLSSIVPDETYEYDVRRTPIKTGLLPAYLHRNKKSVRSRHPINTMVAMGPLAHYLMEDNLSGDSPLPCGYSSSWSKCVENDAIIISIGTDLTHSLTAIHVVEDRMDTDWPIRNWYRTKKFVVTDGEFTKEVTLRERRPKWGALHFAERTLCKDLLNEGLLSSTKIDGVLVEVIRAKALIQFLESRNRTGYPYYGVKL
ncbi:AAC(3) family N-acetyltransferase [Vibrio sp. THAF190c]|uniref:AAC(3) family N-acetyltransferase n=1 Tax=Vibrio sp. THAF190c TaxID=2587865 RepID=UPI0012692A62|nr:AAC(3) family N-acetyltransferase [Vibrio sp. THAF190c]QFT08594.1 Aminoglycoside 3-N-acetyltransferase [Vibrio sp. THAF190c]